MKPIKSECGVWMDEITGYSIARQIAVDLMRSSTADLNNWRMRDAVVMLISEKIGAALDLIEERKSIKED